MLAQEHAIVVPGDQHIRYIWSNDFATYDRIGLEEDYAPGEKEWIEAILHEEETSILHLKEDKVKGRLATVAAPIFNGQGEPVALAMVDFSMTKIDDAIRKLNLSISIYVILLMSAYMSFRCSSPCLRASGRESFSA